MNATLQLARRRCTCLLPLAGWLVACSVHAQNAPTQSDWGGAGLLQTPTARMADEGEVAFTASQVTPYTRYNFTLQPLPWLEGIIRYTDVGNRLYYPLRQDSIRVVGAVQQPCTLPQVPLQDARDYLAFCTATRAADQDDIYVIEPDGRVFVQGIALWNRSTPLTLAPGALIYVPLSARAIKSVDPLLNHDLAAFLATQLLPGPRTN